MEDISIEKITDYDFLDFGASTGSSIDFALRYLGGKKGVGVDIDPKKVKQMIGSGYKCIQGDITKLKLPPKSVRFVIMSHILEHLPNITEVSKAIASSAHVASDFLYIQGPFFDADTYLESIGFRFYWSYWRGHTCHLCIKDLYKILLSLQLQDHVFLVRNEISNSLDRSIHPLDSFIDQHEYDPKIHPPKRYEEFKRPIPRDFICCVRLSPFQQWDQIISARKGARMLSVDEVLSW